MPTIIVQGVAGLMMAAYLFVSGMSGVIPADTISVVIMVDGEKTPAEVTLDNKRVKVTFKRRGNDIELWYDRSSELNPTDKKMIDEIIKQINHKTTGQKIAKKVRDKFSNALKALLTAEFDVDDCFAPFIEQFGEKAAEEYMFMYRDGDGFYAYKNIMTREYIYIKEGNFYKYRNGKFKPTDKKNAWESSHIGGV